jgi:hypothetical protein
VIGRKKGMLNGITVFIIIIISVTISRVLQFA